jgi:hypothetical protein
MGYESYLSKRRYQEEEEEGATNRAKNIGIRYVSVVSLSRLLLRFRADISKVTAHERIQYLYLSSSRFAPEIFNNYKLLKNRHIAFCCFFFY